MIVLRLHGGLGNQLFHFAAGQVVRKRTGARMRYLTDAFTPGRARADRPFLLPQIVACEEGLLREGTLGWNAALLRHRALRPGGFAVRHIPYVCHITNSPRYDPSFDRITDHMLVSGYFQARQCVLDDIDDMRARVAARFGPRIEAAGRMLRARFPGERLVALHIRQGDYRLLGDGDTAIVPMERIRAAVDALPRGSRVIAFTDSPEALAGFERSVDNGLSDDPVEDFARMAACDDFVIANSTFSWWASILGQSAGKTIWAPNDWERPGRPGSDPDNDLYLSEHRRY